MQPTYSWKWESHAAIPPVVTTIRYNFNCVSALQKITFSFYFAHSVYMLTIEQGTKSTIGTQHKFGHDYQEDQLVKWLTQGNHLSWLYWWIEHTSQMTFHSMCLAVNQQNNMVSINGK